MVNYRVEASVDGSLKVPRYLEKVYSYADEDRGFYTSETSVTYRGETLILNIAFHSMREAINFLVHINGIGEVFIRSQILKDRRKYGPDSEIYFDDCLFGVTERERYFGHNTQTRATFKLRTRQYRSFKRIHYIFMNYYG